jgi:hypothetical protein
MRSAAIIEAGIVTNVIVIAEGKEGDQALTTFNAIEITDQDVRIGDKYDGESFTRIKTKEELDGEQALIESQKKRKELALKLGLTEQEVFDLLGL